MSHVKKTETCWLWTAHVMKRGHGRVRSDGRLEVASRIAYQLFKGPIPKGLWVLHTCDIRHCVNPNHLYVGSAQRNTLDMYERKRRRQDGILNGNSKLSLEQIEEIRNLHASGDFTQTALGKRFNVSQRQIGNIIHFLQHKKPQ